VRDAERWRAQWARHARALLSEVSALLTLEHPNIVKVCGVQGMQGKGAWLLGMWPESWGCGLSRGDVGMWVVQGITGHAGKGRDVKMRMWGTWGQDAPVHTCVDMIWHMPRPTCALRCQACCVNKLHAHA
jgi:hypothetical protein